MLWGRRTRGAGRFEPGPFALAMGLEAAFLKAAVLRVPKAAGYRVSLRCDPVPVLEWHNLTTLPILLLALDYSLQLPHTVSFRVAPCTLPAPVPNPCTSLNPTFVLQLSQLTRPAFPLLPYLTRLFEHCCSLCPLSVTTSDPLAPLMFVSDRLCSSRECFLTFPHPVPGPSKFTHVALDSYPDLEL